jgi:spore coat protein U-like protein
MRTSILKISLLGTLLCASSMVLAGTSPQTTNLAVSANVAGSCTITGTTALAFGAYDPADVNFAANLDATGSVTVRCTRGTVASVNLGQGLNAAAGSTCVTPQRRMSDGGTERLGYALYQDAARSTVWGCDTTNDQSYTSAGPSAPTTLTVYGRIPGGQDAAPGSYSDTVVVTVSF